MLTNLSPRDMKIIIKGLSKQIEAMERQADLTAEDHNAVIKDLLNQLNTVAKELNALKQGAEPADLVNQNKTLCAQNKALYEACDWFSTGHTAAALDELKKVGIQLKNDRQKLFENRKGKVVIELLQSNKEAWGLFCLILKYRTSTNDPIRCTSLNQVAIDFCDFVYKACGIEFEQYT